MSEPTDNPDPRPVRQIQGAVAELLAEGKSEEAIDLSLSALRTVVERNAHLEILVRKLRKQLAGKSSSEKLTPGQLAPLFALLGVDDADSEPEVELEAKQDAALDKEIEEAQAESDQGSDKKKKRRRNKALNTEGLRVSRTDVEVPQDQREWEIVGEKIERRLRFSPAEFWIEETHQPIVRNPTPPEDGSLGDVVVSAPPCIVPGGMAGNDVVAMLLLRKFEEHTPLTRMHREFMRDQGLDLPVSTMADWVAWGGRALERVAALLLREIPDSFLVQTDATGMQVLDSGPENVHRGTFHAYLGRSEDPLAPPQIAFHYTPTGEAEHGPWTILAARKGYVLADASNSFDRLFNGQVASATEVGCWFHARRKFKAHDDDPRSAYPLQLARRLYRLETLADAKKLFGESRTALRRRRSKPVLKKLYRYLKKLTRDATPDDPLHKAAQYSLNHWEALTRFADDGRLPLDNNDVERLFRGVRIGERNYFFAGSDEAAKRMAAILSVLASAKAHGLNLREYLLDILDRLSHPMSEEQIKMLLPAQWKAARSDPREEAEAS